MSTAVDVTASSVTPLGTALSLYRARERARRGLQSFIRTYLRTHDRNQALRALTKEVLGQEIGDIGNTTVETVVRVLWTFLRKRYGIAENTARDEAIVSGLSNFILTLSGS